jgi:LysM repeat protein
MKVRQEILTGVISAAASVLLIFGAFSMALAEGMSGISTTPAMSETGQTATLKPAESTKTQPPPVNTAAVLPNNTSTTTLTATQGPSATNTPVPNTATATVTITPTITQTVCPYPKGWVKYTVKDGDTLEKLADKRNTTVEKIKAGNCLASDELPSGKIIYLPKLPQTSTATPQPVIPTTVVVYCGPPAGWVQYVIQSGDTLYRISRMYSTSVNALMQANCLNSDLIRAGAKLYVPNVTPIAPTLTVIPTTKPSK